ncbi:hypothetical protein PAMA_009459 [Pampus argenteus]
MTGSADCFLLWIIWIELVEGKWRRWQSRCFLWLADPRLLTSYKRGDSLNPCHVGSFAPVSSTNDSEVSSDALTDDAMSVTDSSVLKSEKMKDKLDRRINKLDFILLEVCFELPSRANGDLPERSLMFLIGARNTPGFFLPCRCCKYGEKRRDEEDLCRFIPRALKSAWFPQQKHKDTHSHAHARTHSALIRG